MGRLHVVQPTLRPCFGVANANDILVSLLHWEQIHLPMTVQAPF